MAENSPVFFAPQLFIPEGTRDVSFYYKAFGAMLLNEWRNDDGTLHVAELAIGRTLFHLHEERPAKGQFEPGRIKGITTLIGLFVEDVDPVVKSALDAGATILNPAQDYDYGYRQAEILDPFGHQWLIEMKI